MQEFRVTMHENGRIVIPIACRKALGLSRGTEVVIILSHDEAKFFSLKHAVKKAQQIVKQYTKGNANLTQELIDMRRHEAKNE